MAEPAGGSAPRDQLIDSAAGAASATASFDVLIVGSGVAGLSLAVQLGRRTGVRVALVTKADLSDSATRWAQGGVAAVLDTASASRGVGALDSEKASGSCDPSDSPELHLADTLAAGGGLCDLDAVRVLVEEGPKRVEELLSLGAVFDREAGGDLERAREGGHSRARVLHAGGVATGAEIERALIQAAHMTGITILEGWFALDLLVSEGRCSGALVMDEQLHRRVVKAQHVVLATGGAGQLYSVTTNPLESTGDGLAMALRARVPVADIEFVQFHPTALHHPVMPRPLISEALRGHGALLKDAHGERFVDELLPRDVVSRAIALRMREEEVEHLWLDATCLDGFAKRFPSINAVLVDVGFDPATDWLPIAPAAHHMSGGVLTDLDGATAVHGLWAVGEVACTGAHGANRLASNSLLEGMVFAARAARAIEDGVDGPSSTGVMRVLLEATLSDAIPREGALAFLTLEEARHLACWPATSTPVVGPRDRASVGGEEIAELRRSLQATMTLNAGVVRDGRSLERTRDLLYEFGQPEPADVASAELANMVTVAGALLDSAACRQESRGAHYRRDFPTEDPKWRVRIVHGALGETAALQLLEHEEAG